MKHAHSTASGTRADLTLLRARARASLCVYTAALVESRLRSMFHFLSARLSSHGSQRYAATTASGTVAAARVCVATAFAQPQRPSAAAVAAVVAAAIVAAAAAAIVGQAAVIRNDAPSSASKKPAHDRRIGRRRRQRLPLGRTTPHVRALKIRRRCRFTRAYAQRRVAVVCNALAVKLSPLDRLLWSGAIAVAGAIVAAATLAALNDCAAFLPQHAACSILSARKRARFICHSHTLTHLAYAREHTHGRLVRARRSLHRRPFRIDRRRRGGGGGLRTSLALSPPRTARAQHDNQREGRRRCCRARARAAASLLVRSTVARTASANARRRQNN